jgi:hypothetical protein
MHCNRDGASASIAVPPFAPPPVAPRPGFAIALLSIDECGVRTPLSRTTP